MTVAELRERLADFQDDDEVRVCDSERGLLQCVDISILFAGEYQGGLLHGFVPVYREIGDIPDDERFTRVVSLRGRSDA